MLAPIMTHAEIPNRPLLSDEQLEVMVKTMPHVGRKTLLSDPVQVEKLHLKKLPHLNLPISPKNKHKVLYSSDPLVAPNTPNGKLIFTCPEKFAEYERAHPEIATHFKFLMVDDNDLNLTIGSRYLCRTFELECMVLTCNKSTDFERYYNASKWDTVFVDIEMPEWDGLYLIENFLQRKHRRNNEPVLAYTARCNAENKVEYELAGFDYCIPKNFRLDDEQALKTSIKDLLIGLMTNRHK